MNGANNWQTTFAWGRDMNHPGNDLDGFLLESAVNFNHTHTVFGRFENVQKDELFEAPSPLAGEVFRVSKLSAGYIYDFPETHGVQFGVTQDKQGQVGFLRRNADGRQTHDPPVNTPLALRDETHRVVDVVALLLDHPISDHDAEAVDGGYVARLAAQDWGLHRTLQLNTAKVRDAVKELEVDGARVNQRLDELWTRIDARPKSLKWKVRARVGERVSWYELPEEVRQPYQKD